MNKKLVGFLALVGLAGWAIVALQGASVEIGRAYWKGDWIKCKVKNGPYRDVVYIHPDYAAIFGITNKQVLNMQEFDNLRNPIQIERTFELNQPDVDP